MNRNDILAAIADEMDKGKLLRFQNEKFDISESLFKLSMTSGVLWLRERKSGRLFMLSCIEIEENNLP